MKTAKMKRCYFDFLDMLKTNPSGNVPYTPTLSLLYGLQESLRMLREEGMDNVAARHYRCAAYHSSTCTSRRRALHWLWLHASCVC